MRTRPDGLGQSIRKGLAIGLTAGVLGGAAAGFAFGVPGLSGAASPSVVQQTEDPVPSSDPRRPTRAPDPTGGTGSDEEPGTRLRDALQPLVDDGTITAAQADAVVAQLQDSLPGRGAGHGGGRWVAVTAAGTVAANSADSIGEVLRRPTARHRRRHAARAARGRSQPGRHRRPPTGSTPGRDRHARHGGRPRRSTRRSTDGRHRRSRGDDPQGRAREACHRTRQRAPSTDRSATGASGTTDDGSTRARTRFAPPTETRRMS